MARQDFINQLLALGYEVEDLGEKRIAYKYVIPVGKHMHMEVKLGLEVTDDFPLVPPSGPHVSPRLLPIDKTQDPHPKGGVHESPQFGSEWEYWSRPFPDWGRTDHSVKTYMAHIRHLFETL